jgi:phosphoglycerate kinase
MSALRTLDNYLKKHSVKGKRVLVRVDLNVPMSHGRVTDDTRMTSLKPTIDALVSREAKVILLSHFGRPKGEFVRDMSLAPLTDALSQSLGGQEIKFGVDCIGHEAETAVENLKNGEILLLENIRFHKGEEKNDPKFAKELAKLGELYVNDTLSSSHRAHASVVGITQCLPSVAGYLLAEELTSLEAMLGSPKRPCGAIVGGSKVSTKLDLLETLVGKVEVLAIGGGMANTFLYAKGHEVGDSLCEKELKATAQKIMNAAKKNGCNIILPKDVVVAQEFKEFAPSEVYDIEDMPKKGMILDIGPESIVEIAKELRRCKTLVWNGPLGAFEMQPFNVGTVTLARTVASLTRQEKLISVAGGGDVLSALTGGGLKHAFSYISTAGGAFLEWLEGKELPGIKVLKDNDKQLQAMGASA